MKDKCINIFQYDWAIQIHTVNLANVAVEKGYTVNFFLCNCSEAVCPITAFDSRINIYQYGKKNNYFKKKINSRFYKLFRFHVWIDRVDDEIIEWSAKQIDTNSKNVFIGIEKKGLIWAGALSKKINATLVYYSLEIYYENPGFIEKRQYNYLRQNEVEYHKLTQVTLIQDYFRASHLLRNNNYPNTQLIFCPVSIRTDNIIIDEELMLKRQNNPLVLYLGKISKHRFGDEICSLTNSCNANFKVWFHGYCEDSYKKQLLSNSNPHKLKFTDTLLPYDQVKEYIKEAAIGICLYKNDYCNDRLTAFSSEKVAVYLSLGMPIVTFFNETTELLYNKFTCGIAISNILELESAINSILSNYKFFSAQALLAYNEIYDFDKNIEGLFQKIEA